MKQWQARSARSSRLPAMLRPLFWDYDFEALAWENDRDLIIGRVLSVGTWEVVSWLRSHVGDQELREWIERRQGRGLTPQQLRFWELILRLPHRQVNTWLAREGRQIWDKRTPKGSVRHAHEGGSELS